MNPPHLPAGVEGRAHRVMTGASCLTAPPLQSFGGEESEALSLALPSVTIGIGTLAAFSIFPLGEGACEVGEPSLLVWLARRPYPCLPRRGAQR